MVQLESICALATPQGVGALAILRVSGEKSLEIVNQIFKGKDLTKVKPNTIHFGQIVDGDKTVDEVLVSVFHAPKSFTKEDSIEISCHGSDYIVRYILKLLVKNGCRLANPGEFTQRAFLNGQFDLAQAEAVADLISADSAASHEIAINQLKGGFSKKLAVLREELIHFASLVELELDFGEEDVEFADRADLKQLIFKIQSQIKPLIDSFESGNAIKEGISVAIIGAPNAGKSTLLNAILNEDKAIVTEIAGTTRDIIEDVIFIKGTKFRIIDTAGIRQTTDVIESMGIERSKKALEMAKIVIFLYDSDESKAFLEEFESDLTKDKEVIWVKNKIDLQNQDSAENQESRTKSQDLSENQESRAKSQDLSENQESRAKNQEFAENQESRAKSQESLENQESRAKSQESLKNQESRAKSQGFFENQESKAKNQDLSENQESRAKSQEFVENQESRAKSQELNFEIPHSQFRIPNSTFPIIPLKISAKDNIGIEELKEEIIRKANKFHLQDTTITNIRHFEHLNKAKEALDEVLNGLDHGITGDFLAQDIRLSLHHLGEITGTITTNDLLANIFGKFCIGK